LLLSYGALTLGAAMLPFMVTMIVMLAPVHWLFAGSERR
jgi:hypothetical protein